MGGVSELSGWNPCPAASFGITAFGTTGSNDLHVAMFSEREEQVTAALKPFYGLGRGLTPSGDDFIIGLLLVLSRWPDSVSFHPHLANLLEGIASDAQLQTTRISQAMITCAARGYADERLLGAVDGIITGQKPVEECAALLVSYGGSSGIDALVGVSITATGGGSRRPELTGRARAPRLAILAPPADLRQAEKAPGRDGGVGASILPPAYFVKKRSSAITEMRMRSP